MTATHCPLCLGIRTNHWWRDTPRGQLPARDYWRCRVCQTVFVKPESFLDAQAEKAHYDLHDNQVDDPDYRRFLNRLASPLLASLTGPARGLDFGCGRGPALAGMLREAGHEVALYDRFYHPDNAVLSATYQFITATEVVEHLHCPRQELERLWSLLVPGGILAIMTKQVRGESPQEAFAAWHYKNDPTHVVFFARASFAWLASQWRATLACHGSDVVLLYKPE